MLINSNKIKNVSQTFRCPTFILGLLQSMLLQLNNTSKDRQPTEHCKGTLGNLRDFCQPNLSPNIFT